MRSPSSMKAISSTPARMEFTASSSNAQFMDGIALAGLLPAPLVIFATFVGYIGGGP